MELYTSVVYFNQQTVALVQIICFVIIERLFWGFLNLPIHLFIVSHFIQYKMVSKNRKMRSFYFYFFWLKMKDKYTKTQKKRAWERWFWPALQMLSFAHPLLVKLHKILCLILLTEMKNISTVSKKAMVVYLNSSFKLCPLVGNN